MKDLLTSFLSLYGWVILLALGTVIALYYLAPYGFAAIKMQTALKQVRGYLASKLGEKAASIIDIWIEGLDAIKDGNFTEEEMIEEFIKIIKLRAATVTLTAEDEKAVEEAARMTIQSIKGKQANKVAFKILSKK
jgi:hypothetical protein